MCAFLYFFKIGETQSQGVTTVRLYKPGRIAAEALFCLANDLLADESV